MWVGGIGADTSYVNLPEKNRERWRIDPFVGVGGNDGREKGRPPMMFNTGDLGRWRKDGQLEHMGRADDQVKVKGFRVELDGVSAAMRVSTFLIIVFAGYSGTNVSMCTRHINPSSTP